MVEKKTASKKTTEAAEKPKKLTESVSKSKVKKEAVSATQEAELEIKESVQELPDRYAIFKSGGKQYYAIEGKTVAIEKIEGESAEKCEFKEVLFRKLGDGKFEIGKPLVEGAVIKASVVKQDKAPKVIVFKFKRRKKSRVKKGHRQPFTVVRIESI